MYYDIYILSSLMQKPMYGYEIRKNLQGRFGACTRISNNSLYPLLKKFEQIGYIIKEIEIQTGKPNRICYQITDQGKKYFLVSLNTVSESVKYDRNEFLMRVLYFHLITPSVRQKLLDDRLAFLNQALRNAQNMKSEEGVYGQKVEDIITLHFVEYLNSEIDLINKLKKKINAPCQTPEIFFLL